MSRRKTSRIPGKGYGILIIIAGLLLAGLFGVYMMSLIRPTITWVKPYYVHIDKIDYSGVLALHGPITYARTSFCKSNINENIYFSRDKPSGWLSDQYKYVEGDDYWLWEFDYQDNVDCAPDLGIFVKKIYEEADPRTGILTVRYDLKIILGADEWIPGWPGMEGGAKFLNSYIILLIDSPYYVLSAQLNQKEASWWYDTDGKTKLIIPIGSDIPSTVPIGKSLLPWIPWVEFGITFEHQLVVKVHMNLVQEYATKTIMPTTTLWASTPVATYPGTQTTTYTALVSATTTITATNFYVVTEKVTTSVSGTKTVTYTTYIPTGTTVYNTATFTIPIVITKETTVTQSVKEPTTITIVYTTTKPEKVEITVYIEKLLKETPIWVWVLVLAVFLLMIVSVATMVRSAGSRATRKTDLRRRAHLLENFYTGEGKNNLMEVV
ncbi:MAG: hypothetical protein QXW42_04210 [Thermofilum sp.]